MSARRLWLPLAFIAAALACTQAFSPAEQLTTPRVLALRTDPVVLLPDGSVTLQALVYVPGDETASSASYAWSWCPELGTSSDNYACAITAADLSSALDPDGGVSLSYDAGTSATVLFSWPVSAAQLEALCATGGGFNPDAGDGGSDGGDDAGASDAGSSDAGSDGGTSSTIRLQCNGSLSVTVLLSLTAQGTQVNAERTLTAAFTEPSLLNTNPSVHTLTATPDGGTTVAASGQLLAGQTYALQAVLVDGTSEAYTQTFGGGGTSSDAGTDGGSDGGMDQAGQSRTVTTLEGLTIAWYVEQGTLAHAKTTLAQGQLDDAGADGRDFTALLDNSWTLPATTRGAVKVIAVIRDTRNGVGWVQSSFEVVP